MRTDILAGLHSARNEERTYAWDGDWPPDASRVLHVFDAQLFQQSASVTAARIADGRSTKSAHLPRNRIAQRSFLRIKGSRSCLGEREIMPSSSRQRANRSLTGHGNASVHEQHEEDDDRNWHAQEPQQYRSHRSLLFCCRPLAGAFSVPFESEHGPDSLHGVFPCRRAGHLPRSIAGRLSPGPALQAAVAQLTSLDGGEARGERAGEKRGCEPERELGGGGARLVDVRLRLVDDFTHPGTSIGLAQAGA